MTISEKLKTVSDNVPKVYESGRDMGKSEEWSKFWDSYQQNGARTDYSHAFGRPWTEETFRPKYDIFVIDGSHMFFASKIAVDLEEFLKELGVKIVFKPTYSLYYGFLSSAFTALPTIDLSDSEGYSYATFAYCRNLKKIEKIIFKADVNDLTQWFDECVALEEIRFDGDKINCNIDIHWSTKLSAESIHSIFTALSDDVTGKTVTFPSTAPATYRATYGAEPDDSWSLATGSRSNWTFVLQ